MDEDRFVISDDVWVRMEPHLPGKEGDRGATGKDNRLFLEAVLWRVRTGLAARYGVVAWKLMESLGDSQAGRKMIHPMDGSACAHSSHRQRETALSRHELA